VADLARAVADTGGSVDAIDVVRAAPGAKVRDLTVLARDADHIEAIAGAARAVPGIEVENVSDRTFLLHLGGKIEVRSKAPLATRDDLSMAYTPGEARICRAIAQEPERVWRV
jgi:malate dehydrogenase (oxaloacetate-decarboxylating)